MRTKPLKGFVQFTFLCELLEPILVDHAPIELILSRHLLWVSAFLVRSHEKLVECLPLSTGELSIPVNVSHVEDIENFWC